MGEEENVPVIFGRLFSPPHLLPPPLLSQCQGGHFMHGLAASYRYRYEDNEGCVCTDIMGLVQAPLFSYRQKPHNYIKARLPPHDRTRSSYILSIHRHHNSNLSAFFFPKSFPLLDCIPLASIAPDRYPFSFFFFFILAFNHIIMPTATALPVVAPPAVIGPKTKRATRPMSQLPQHLIEEARVPKKVPFDPGEHLNVVQPERLYTMEEIGLEGQGISPIAASEPFSLFTPEAIQQMRAEIFSDAVLEKCQYSSDFAKNMIRGFGPKFVHLSLHRSKYRH